ncbi:hypothetical protein PPSIR1_26823, partial [Plesiocystis pacifica SIR-1]
ETDTDTGTGTGTGTEPTIEPFDPLAPGELPCAAAEWSPDAFIALITGESTAHLLRGDGTTLALDTSLPDAAPDAELRVATGNAGDWIITVSYDDVDGLEHDLARYRGWSRSTGALMWEHVEAGTETEPAGSWVRVSEDGRFIVMLPGEGDTSWGRAMDAFGVIGTFYCSAISPIAPDDWHACVGGDDFEPSWFNAVLSDYAGGGQLYDYEFFAGYDVLPDGTFVYLGHVEGAPDTFPLVEERLDELTIHPLSEAQPYFADPDWSLGSTGLPERWLSFQREDEFHLLRFGEGDELLETLVMFAPPGTDNDPHFWTFTDEGAPLVLWSEGGAWTARIHVEAGLWAPAPMLHPSTGAYFERAWIEDGTMVMTARIQDPQALEPPGGTVHGPSLQLSRPSAGTKLVIQPFVAFPRLTAEGQCVARPQGEDPELPWRIDDLENQLFFEVPEPGTLDWL